MATDDSFSCESFIPFSRDDSLRPDTTSLRAGVITLIVKITIPDDTHPALMIILYCPVSLEKSLKTATVLPP
jgi:hypothetical protein